MVIKRSGFKIKNNTISGIIFDIFNYCFLAFLGLLTLYPFLRVLAVSLSAPYALESFPLAIFPRKFSIESYKTMLQNQQVITSFFNSVYITVLGSFLDVLITSMLAYALSKRNLPGRNVITVLVVFTMFFGPGLIPIFLNVKSLGLIDTRWALILPRLVNTYFMLICRNFFMSISSEIEESAKVDGANDITIYFRLIVPISKPVLLTLLLWYGVGKWNNYLDSMIYITTMDKRVLQNILREIIRFGSQDGQNFDIGRSTQKGMETLELIRSSVIVISTVPILLVYPFIQKHFVKGIMIGSLKG